MRMVVIFALLVAGCTKPNPNYCVGESCPDGTPIPCTTSSDSCVCLNPPGVCVQCTATDERKCEGATPQCGDDNRCRGCVTNEDCNDSGACLEDGRCADKGNIVYVTPGGLQTSPCGTELGQNECALAQALNEVTATRNIIRLAPGTYMVSGVDGLDFSAKSGTVVARGATITRAPTGPLMSARNGQSLKIIGGTLRGANNADGIRCNTGGKLQVFETTIERMDESAIEGESCELTVSRATLRRNILGGINMVGVSKVATITNNMIYRNGQGVTSSVGGMVLLLAQGSKVEFNTVVDNQANFNSATAGGIACDGQGYDAPHNLVYRNTGGTGGLFQVNGTCTFMGSYQKAAGSLDENAVGFENPNDPTNPSFRLTAQSPIDTIKDAIEAAECSSVDFEGDPRPQPTDGKCDIGADELRVDP